jgi:hypothetical protein
VASSCGGETVVKGGYCISDLIRSQQNAAVRELESGRGTEGRQAHRRIGRQLYRAHTELA